MDRHNSNLFILTVNPIKLYYTKILINFVKGDSIGMVKWYYERYKIPDNPRCCWCFEPRPRPEIDMSSFDGKQFYIHKSCHVEFMEMDFEGREEWYPIMDAEFERSGKGFEGLLAGKITCNSPVFGCQTSRAQYERKKMATQIPRYDEALELASEIEAKQISLEVVAKKMVGFKDEYWDGKKIDNTRLKVSIKKNLNVKLGMGRTREVKILLLALKPDLFV